ncbi:unnamed protein product [Moneuplotes crassus]|uniref:Uncharacterized protein n=1 Tax=Euplotes crassus TaxID=5936 RepID=A0AAD1X8N6_EUPCR|nr:unnamed protein product [Moneuplotes crassus]
MDWSDFSEMKQKINDFWEVLFKDYTEPYMSKYHKQIFKQIMKKVFEERSAQIKKAKLECNNFQHDSDNNNMVSSLYRILDAYNLDNNDLDYVAYKKYLLKLANLEQKVRVEDLQDRKKMKRTHLNKRLSMVSPKWYQRLASPDKKKAKTKNKLKGQKKYKRRSACKHKGENKVIQVRRNCEELEKDSMHEDIKDSRKCCLLNLNLRVTRDQYFDYLLANDPTFCGFKKVENKLGQVIDETDIEVSQHSSQSTFKMNDYIIQTQRTEKEPELGAPFMINYGIKENNLRFHEDAEGGIDKTESNFVEIAEETPKISFAADNSQIDTGENKDENSCKEKGLNHLKRKFKKRNVISALTRKTNSFSRTRPSTASVNASRRAQEIPPRGNNLRSVSVITERVRLKSAKRRPKTGKQRRSVPILPAWADSVAQAKLDPNYKDFEIINNCIRKCDQSLRVTRGQKKLVKKIHKRLKSELTEHKESIEKTKKVLTLGKKYVDSCVRQFRRDKKAFIYGKDPSKAHYIQDRGKGVFTTMERISKLNPKYIGMMKDMKKRIDEKDHNLLLF